jgi:hypothetical protein
MRALLAGLLLLATSTIPLAARADTLDLFTLTGGGNTSTWTLPSVVSFTVRDGLGPFYSIFPITLTTNGVTTNSTVMFEEGHIVTLSVGGLDIINMPYLQNPTFVSDNGTVSFYTATFDLGTFYGGAYVYSNGGYTYTPYTLTIAEQQATATPEPSSLILLATGVFAAAPTLRRRLMARR